MTEEQIEKIERYLNNELSESEKVAFESDLKQDAELQKQVEFMTNLPKAVRINVEDEFRKRLQEIEASLPVVPKEPYTVDEAQPTMGEPAIGSGPPKGVSGSNWVRVAAAACVLLLIGLLLFKNEIFNNRSAVFYSQNGIDTLNKGRDERKYLETQIAILRIPVAKIEDAKLGFVKNDTAKTLPVVITKPGNTDSSTRGMFYKFQNDTLFIQSTDSIYQVRIFEFNISAQSGSKLNSRGEMVYYEKPELKGNYININNDFYRLDKKQLLSEVGKKVIDNPFVGRNLSRGIAILSIEVNSSDTRIDFINRADRTLSNEWVCIDTSTFIRTIYGNQKLTLIRAKNIKTCPDKDYFKNQDDSIYFSLFFPRLPDKVDVINIIENESVSDSTSILKGDHIYYFNFYNIRLNLTNYVDLKDKKIENRGKLNALRLHSLN